MLNRHVRGRGGGAYEALAVQATARPQEGFPTACLGIGLFSTIQTVNPGPLAIALPALFGFCTRTAQKWTLLFEAADVEAKAAEAVAEVESGNLEDEMAMKSVWEDWLGWVVWLGVHLGLTGEL